jgi:hypothetical protein
VRHIGNAFNRYYWRWLFRLAKGRIYRGVNVRVLLAIDAKPADLLKKTDAAIELIANNDQRQHDRILRLVDGILVFGEAGAQGEWHEPARLIRLNERYIADSSVQAPELAATIVHETTHAWLNAWQFRYVAARRQRLEAICQRSAAAFLRRIPDGQTLAARYDEWADAILSDPESEWSDAALDQHHAEDLAQMSVPRWLIQLLMGRRRDPAA